jgi:hypothetical protein
MPGGFPALLLTGTPFVWYRFSSQTIKTTHLCLKKEALQNPDQYGDRVQKAIDIWGDWLDW